MRIFRHFDDLPERDVRGAAVAIGNFDGVHLGHRAVINEAGRAAKAHGAPWAVLTFEPHPRSVFRPQDPAFRLTPFRTKARHIEEMGVDVLIVQHFDPAFAAVPAEDFVDKVLVEALGAIHVVSGYDFVFGKGRGGDCDMLLAHGREKGFAFTAVPKVVDENGEVYSSTRVRNCLAVGDARGAAKVLGRPFEIDGRIEHGEARGRTIGVPTANIHLGEYICPTLGVYAVRAGIDKGPQTEWFDGVANVGVRPTFDGEGVVLEAHLFDFNQDLYGKHLRVALVDYLRAEQKFDGLDALKAQIAVDCDNAKRVLSEMPV